MMHGQKNIKSYSYSKCLGTNAYSKQVSCGTPPENHCS